MGSKTHAVSRDRYQNYGLSRSRYAQALLPPPAARCHTPIKCLQQAAQLAIPSLAELHSIRPLIFPWSTAGVPQRKPPALAASARMQPRRSMQVCSNSTGPRGPRTNQAGNKSCYRTDTLQWTSGLYAHRPWRPSRCLAPILPALTGALPDGLAPDVKLHLCLGNVETWKAKMLVLCSCS